MSSDEIISESDVIKFMDRLSINKNIISPKNYTKALIEELVEHGLYEDVDRSKCNNRGNVIGFPSYESSKSFNALTDSGPLFLAAKIVYDHLKTDPKYYERLDKLEQEAKNEWKGNIPSIIVKPSFDFAEYISKIYEIEDDLGNNDLLYLFNANEQISMLSSLEIKFDNEQPIIVNCFPRIPSLIGYVNDSNIYKYHSALKRYLEIKGIRNPKKYKKITVKIDTGICGTFIYEWGEHSEQLPKISEHSEPIRGGCGCSVGGNKDPIIIVGTGISGLLAAWNNAKNDANRNVIVIEKMSEKEMFGNSKLASSGIAIAENQNDVNVLFNDIVKASEENENRLNVELIKKICVDSVGIKEMLDKEFGIKLTVSSKPAGHSVSRVWKTREMQNIGSVLCQKVYEKLKSMKNVNFIFNACVKKFDASKKTIDTEDSATYKYHKLILATGGCGYEYAKSKGFLTSNYKSATSDGIKILDNSDCGDTIGFGPEYMLWHPTAFESCKPDDSIRRILVPEALRNFGAYITDYNSKKVGDGMKRKELSDFLLEGMKKGDKYYIYVPRDESVKGYGEEELKHYFREACFSIDLFAKGSLYAQITPVIHFTSSGMMTELGSTKLKGCGDSIHAIGEAVGGIHGKCRICGASLLFAIASGLMA